MKAVSVIFSGSQNRYDYLCPFDVSVGDEVIVETKRGEVRVIVAEVKDHSDRATASIKRMADPKPGEQRNIPF